ncbi:MBL fold metallo-hydrolase [Nocardioides sp. Bht2]|uniref:MBL fold metallo-hydrolase n=1 Tax=Nocardioides sp. Bht2 TaxID=3392297 RepID=UPI0039B68466
MSTPFDHKLAELHRAKQVAPPTALGDGIYAIGVPLAGSPLRSITVYALRTSAGLVLIDAAYEHPTCWSSLTSSLAAIGHRITDVVAVLLTHNHPDHLGLAEQIREASGATLTIHRRDDFGWQRQERGGFLDQLRTVLGQTGVPDETGAEMFEAATKVAVHRESMTADRILVDAITELTFGDVTLRAIHAPGHTYGHTVYQHPAGFVFTGDTLMPEGSTQLALAPLRHDDPVGDLLGSFATIGGLGATVACPAHQYPFLDVEERCHELAALHTAEQARARALATTHLDAWGVAPQLSWAKPWHEMGISTRRFALVHTHALLQPLP